MHSMNQWLWAAQMRPLRLSTGQVVILSFNRAEKDKNTNNKSIAWTIKQAERFGIGSVECFMRGFKGTFFNKRTHAHTRAMLSCGVNVMKMPGGCWSDCAEDETDGDERGEKHKPWRKMNGYLVITQSDGCDSIKLTSMCGQAEVLPAFTLQYTLTLWHADHLRKRDAFGKFHSGFVKNVDLMQFDEVLRQREVVQHHPVTAAEMLSYSGFTHTCTPTLE